jgi:sensor c-di-GMP phosphodiesterase-like protein
MNRASILRISILTIGSALGLAAGFAVGRLLQLKSGQAELKDYVDRLDETGIQISRQTQVTLLTVLNDHLPICSPTELTLMRALVYHNSQIKEIGRVRDHRFICSNSVGALAVPFALPVPDLTFSETKVYVASPMTIAGDSKGFIVQIRDADVVVNPDAFEGFKTADRSFAVFLFHSESGKLIQAYGDAMPISKNEILGGSLLERNDIFYRPHCSPVSRVCVIAAESRQAMLGKSRSTLIVLTLVCALFGSCAALFLLQAYDSHGSQANQLRRAIRRGKLSLVYQPIVNIESRSIVCAEVLARWVNNYGEPVSPEVFIAIAEGKGFITEITRVVLQSAVQELRGLLLAQDVGLSVNISADDLADPGFIPFLQDVVQSAGLKPSSIGLELTERSTADRQLTVGALASLRARGHKIYIDDFGTGYSSLSYLRDLKVDMIKIDRAFTSTIGTDSVAESIVPQILHMASQLGVGVIVEGIETTQQADYFRARGGGLLGQGWLFGKPVTATDLIKLIERFE